MAESKDRIILHCDANNFYASVEAVLNPALKGKAIAVCGNPEKRHGIVLAKSMLAKQAGIRTGDAVWQAQQKCPGLILVPPTFSEYVRYSEILHDIYISFSPDVESFGLDECWIDLTGCKKLWGSGEQAAYEIKEKVKTETGLTISVGVSFNKVFAKLGSDLKKPDAVTVISRENYKYVVWPLPAEEMIYVGHSTAEKLARLNIHTIGDLAMASPELMERKFGKVGLKLRESARGEDTEPVKCYTERHIPKSIGNGTTTPADVTNLDDAASVIFALCEMIGFRLRQANMVAEGVSVNMRSVHLDSFSRQCRLPIPTDSAYIIATAALELLKANYDFACEPPLRTITVSSFGLKPAGSYVQTSLFDEDPGKNARLEGHVDILRKKYGFGVLRRGINIDTIFTCDDREAEDEFLPFNKNMKNLNQE